MPQYLKTRPSLPKRQAWHAALPAIDDTLENQARWMVEVDAVTERLASLRSDDPDTALSEDPTITVVPEPRPVAAALTALGSVVLVARRSRARGRRRASRAERALPSTAASAPM